MNTSRSLKTEGPRLRFLASAIRNELFWMVLLGVILPLIAVLIAVVIPALLGRLGHSI